MKLGQSIYTKRYFIYAKRTENEKWTDWAQTDDIKRAVFHINNIRNIGFYAKLIDQQTKEVLINDRKKDIP